MPTPNLRVDALSSEIMEIMRELQELKARERVQTFQAERVLEVSSGETLERFSATVCGSYRLRGRHYLMLTNGDTLLLQPTDAAPIKYPTD
jgi:hypothetical protein